MEDSKAKEVMKNNGGVHNYIYYSNSHCFFVEALRAVLKCLGIETRTQQSCSSTCEGDDDDGRKGQACPQDSTTTPTNPEADPSVQEDPPIVSVKSAPSQPGVSTGSGGQIH